MVGAHRFKQKLMMILRRFFVAILTNLWFIEYSQEPTHWVLVHASNAVAKAKLAKVKSTEVVTKVATELGYDLVQDKNIGFLFPKPAWSDSSSDVALQLLELSKRGKGGLETPFGQFSRSVQDHVSDFVKNWSAIGNESLLQTSIPKTLSAYLQVDIQLKFGNRSVTIDNRLDKLCELFSDPRSYSKFRPTKRYQSRVKYLS